MNWLLSFLFIFINLITFAQTSTSTDIRVNKYVEGTLLAVDDSSTLAIFVGSSGPVDRNGNQPMMRNNALKKLAKELAKHNISSFRYDKRILKARELHLRETAMRFDDFVVDATAVIDYFETKKTYPKIYLIGHGQGSLVGMIAANEKADGFISIGGAGQSLDQMLISQIEEQAPELEKDARKSLTELKERGRAFNYNPALESLLKKEIQPFMASWMAYNPQEEIKKLTTPVVIIHGKKDLQTTYKEAEKLSHAKPNADLVLIENMNHFFRIIESNSTLENQKSYNQTQLPIADELVTAIVDFIEGNS